MNKPGPFSFVYGWGGYLVDLYRIARARFSHPHSYIKFRNIDSLRRRTGATQFIETGTYRGVTSRRAARIFRKVLTIELDPTLAAESRRQLSDLRHVEVIEGDAMKELPKLLARPDVTDTIIFLDGHFSGSGTALGDMAEPAVEEITMLAAAREKILGIVIDDFRDFGRPGFPAKSQLLEAIERHFLPHGYDMTVFLDQVLVWRSQPAIPSQNATVATATGVSQPS